jgi:hypothetical protein
VSTAVRILVTAAAALALAAAVPVAPPADELAQARATARELMSQTKQLLQTQLRDNGAVGAITSCSQVALQMAKAHEKSGWRVRRVSLKARNLADTPDAWERRRLRELDKRHVAARLDSTAEVAEVVRERGRPVLRYLKPIVMPAEPCLKCHGGPGDIPADVREALAKRYPADVAVGYHAGDLRGAVSVSIPLAPR